MKHAFLPDRRNLGGKQDIDNLQKNHLLALINARSVANNFEAPHAHVNHKKKLMNQKSSIQLQNEFREVFEAKKRVLEMKKGGVDMSEPACFYRRNFIKNRTCTAKNIEALDHQRNLQSLSKKLCIMDSQSEKRRAKLLAEQQKQQYLHTAFCNNLNYSVFQHPDGLERSQKYRSSGHIRNPLQYRQSIDYVEGSNIYNDSQQGINSSRSKPQYTHKPLLHDSPFISMDSSELIPQQEFQSTQNIPQIKNYIASDKEYLFLNNCEMVDFSQEIGQYEEEGNDLYPNTNQQANRKQSFASKNSTQGNQVNLQTQKSKPIHQSIPFLPKGANNDPYTDLRKVLLNVIMDYKLYDKQQMMDLANLILKKNPHLDLQKIQNVCKTIILRLYGEM